MTLGNLRLWISIFPGSTSHRWLASLANWSQRRHISCSDIRPLSGGLTAFVVVRDCTALLLWIWSSVGIPEPSQRKVAWWDPLILKTRRFRCQIPMFLPAFGRTNHKGDTVSKMFHVSSWCLRPPTSGVIISKTEVVSQWRPSGVTTYHHRFVGFSRVFFCGENISKHWPKEISKNCQRPREIL